MKLLKEKIRLFHLNGYVVIRNDNMDKGYNTKLCLLKTYILNRLATQCNSIRYNLWRLWNQVSVSTNRYTLPLPLQAVRVSYTAIDYLPIVLYITLTSTSP